MWYHLFLRYRERRLEGKKETIDIKKLNKLIVDLKEDVGDALLARDVWAAADGQPIVGLNPQPKATAL
jgi:hypothetical protein